MRSTSQSQADLIFGLARRVIEFAQQLEEVLRDIDIAGRRQEEAADQIDHRDQGHASGEDEPMGEAQGASARPTEQADAAVAVPAPTLMEESSEEIECCIVVPLIVVDDSADEDLGQEVRRGFTVNSTSTAEGASRMPLVADAELLPTSTIAQQQRREGIITVRDFGQSLQTAGDPRELERQAWLRASMSNPVLFDALTNLAMGRGSVVEYVDDPAVGDFFDLLFAFFGGARGMCVLQDLYNELDHERTM